MATRGERSGRRTSIPGELLAAILVTALLVGGLVHGAAAQERQYRIGVKDVLKVTVWGHKDLSKTVTVLKRLKETSLTQGLDTNNVRIIEGAAVPRAPVRPQKTRNLVVGVILGPGLGVATALVLEHLDDTVRSPQQVERVTGVPVLAVIPVFAARARS